jgi:TolA-binding protein
MNSQPGKNIFMKQSPPTAGEMERYLSGELSKEEMYRIEQKLSDDSFYSDAAEGFEANPGAMAGVVGLQQQFYDKINQPTNGLWNGKNAIITVLSIVTVTALSLLFYQYAQTDEPTKTGETVEKIPVEPPTPEHGRSGLPIAEHPIEMTDEVLIEEEKEIEDAVLIPKDKQITSTKTIENQPKIVAANIDEPVATPPVRDTTEFALMDPKGNNLHAEPTINKVVKSNVKTKYMHDFLVVDYSELYTSNIRKVIWRNTGTPASVAHRNDNFIATDVHDVRVEMVSYTDFLRDAMKKFKRNDFKGAMKDYLVIMKHFPNDLNAYFYGGLCYYNINKSKKAIRYFDLAASHTYNTFKQEATWYKALSLLQKGDETRARSIMDDIVSENGFYAEHAKKKLNEF